MRSRSSLFSVLSRRSPWFLLCLSGGVYAILAIIVPFSLRNLHVLAPVSRLSSTAAPLLASVLLLPLPMVIWRDLRERRLVRKMMSIDTLRGMRWDELEIVVRRIFEQHGFYAERVGGAGADGGVDIILNKAGRTMLVQCKQWRARQVSVNIVRELAGVVGVHGADGGIVVTCGVFTKEARRFASRSGVVLVDGLELLRMRSATSISIQTSSLSASTSSNAPDSSFCCPFCGAIMVRREVKKGRLTGRKFLGCSNYPACRGTRTI